ncbi:MAG: FKBP-type peptidyl-prolyl cis-trans isomerase [Crocinitomicaceae bacterium]|nr:FKBP-type peptidyl-prolyl cis-trans isomerase [Flavobacteriales bacterium]NQZ36246.1 FKBP-type peptidyl-prolyl cis-trans isomerase [Crocinitomicaceae bacterium]
MKYFLPVLLVVFALTSCAKKNAEEQAILDEEIIQQYITDNNLNAVPTGSGLYYVIDSQGTGDACTSASTVTVAYTGSFIDGVEFEQSPAQGVEFSLQQVIKGWTEGIPYFKEGGVGKLILPSALAYGTSGSASIAPNTVLIFDIELIDVL